MNPIPKNTSNSTPLPVTEQMIRDFQLDLKKRQMSENTILAYTAGVSQFLNLYGAISHDSLKLYKCYLLEHYKPQTINLRIRSINSFMEFLRLDENPITMVHIQQKSFLENVISPADYKYLKQCLLRDGDYLYYFIVRTMAATGARISELTKLQIDDVRRGYLDLYSKGSRARRIYIPLQVRRACQIWLNHQNRQSGYLFLNRSGNPVTPAAVRKTLKRFAGLYGLEPSVLHPHSFRHLFAKNFLETCGDISMLSDILGHESIETTRIYLRRSHLEQKRLVNQIVNW